MPTMSNTSAESEERKENGMLDIRTLREKSRNLDLPLISALCNDRYLLKQTKAFVLPKHPAENTTAAAAAAAAIASTKSPSSRSSANGVATSSSSRSKYPVSGLSATQISKPPRKSSTSTHRHPSEIKGNAYMINSPTTRVSPFKKDLSRASHS